MKSNSTLCSVKSCTRLHKATGLCGMHYARKRKRKDLGGAESTRQPRVGKCYATGCKDDVYGKGLCSKHWQRLKSKGNIADPRPAKIGCSISQCTGSHFAKDMCKKHYEKDRSLTTWYGITLLDVLDKAKKQKNKCAICSIKLDPFSSTTHVDHDHKTGKVRDLLCHHCNTGLGMFKENPDLFKKAVRYLKKHSN